MGWRAGEEGCRICDDFLLRSRFLPELPSQVPKPPVDCIRAFIGDDEVPAHSFRFVPEAPLAGDGSATTSPLESLRRGGWGVVQWDRERGVLLRLIGSLPHFLPQSAVCAEHQAFFAGAEVSDGTCAYIGDCSSVLGSARSGVAQASKCSSLFAGFWRALPRQDGAFRDLVKQKSHVQVREQPATDAEWAAWLNSQADQAAKLGARLHSVGGSLVADLEDRYARVKVFLRSAARVLCAGPAPKQEWAHLRRPPPSRVAPLRLHMNLSKWANVSGSARGASGVRMHPPPL